MDRAVQARMNLSGPPQSPLFHAEHAERYARQELIAYYETTYECRLIVIRDALFSYSVAILEDLIYDANPDNDLHVMLATPGGDGESALRMIRSAQERCRYLNIIVPDQAKSAGTIFALGAHNIIMGPTSDLGPVDPQLQLNPDTGSLVSAKDIIAAVHEAERAVQENPATFPVHASLLANVTALMVQQARSSIGRSGDLVREALTSTTGRTKSQVDSLCAALQQPLIDAPLSHSAVFSASDALRAGLPVTKLNAMSDQWKLIWRLWMKYFVRNERIYEGRRASKVLGPLT